MILVIDDSSDMRALLELALEGEGFHVACARHGEEALRALASGLRPSLILLDLQMEVMDGATFLKELEVRWPSAEVRPPVILMTANTVTPISDFVVGSLRKPVDLSELIRVVSNFESENETKSQSRLLSLDPLL